MPRTASTRTRSSAPTAGVDDAESLRGLNLAVLVGELSSAPEVRDLGERGRVASLAVRTPTADGATSVPVTVWSPPAWLEDASAGTRVVLVGPVRRRFYRSGSGATGSRVEVEASAIARDTARSRVAMWRRAAAALEALA